VEILQYSDHNYIKMVLYLRWLFCQTNQLRWLGMLCKN
jgi:hypothetical protein